MASVSRPPGVVLVDRRRELEYDAAAIVEKQGVAPRLIPDWLALVGDTADGIPGLPGFGKKSAARVLQHYGGLDRIPIQGDWELKVRGAQRLATGRWPSRIDDALLYRRLATLALDVPLPQQSIDELRWNGVPRAEFLEWCRRVGAGRLEARPSRWSDAVD